jgi:hypothetical protein
MSVKHLWLLVMPAVLFGCASGIEPDLYLIKTGMSKKKVIELIGEPDSVDARQTTWFYKPDNNSIQFYNDVVAVVILDFDGYKTLIADGHETKVVDPFLRQFKFSDNLSVDSKDQIVALYNGNLIDTLDRILIKSNDPKISIKGRFYTLILDRQNSSYAAVVVDHTSYSDVPHVIQGRYVDYDVAGTDSLSIKLARHQIAENTYMPIELYLDLKVKPSNTDVSIVLAGKASLPVFSGDDFENVWRPVKYLLKDRSMTR